MSCSARGGARLGFREHSRVFVAEGAKAFDTPNGTLNIFTRRNMLTERQYALHFALLREV